VVDEESRALKRTGSIADRRTVKIYLNCIGLYAIKIPP
jgi:hypothetical protein